MLPIIIIVILVAAVMIALYQVVIQKYYWGPNGPPVKKDTRKAKAGQKE